MGVAAARHADVVVVTDDNPRTEDPATIRAEVLAGARQVPDTEVIDGLDRRHAIGLALGMAHAGDAVAILGKGHETTQEINGVLHPSMTSPSCSRPGRPTIGCCARRPRKTKDKGNLTCVSLLPAIWPSWFGPWHALSIAGQCRRASGTPGGY